MEGSNSKGMKPAEATELASENWFKTLKITQQMVLEMKKGIMAILDTIKAPLPHNLWMELKLIMNRKRVKKMLKLIKRLMPQRM